MTRDITIRSCPDCLAQARSFLRECLDTQPFSPEQVDLMVLAVDEACTNVIRHAYNLEENQLIHILFETCDSCCTIRIRDFGARVDPAKLKPRDLDKPGPGGLGLHFIAKAFDDVEYLDRDPGTELVLVKRL